MPMCHHDVLMRSLKRQSLLGVLLLVIVACGPTSIPTTSEPSPPSTSGPEPDLIVEFMYLEMKGRQGPCVDAYSPYGIRVQVKNIGADAGPFQVELNGVRQEVRDGLREGQSIELHFAGTIPSGQYAATADVTDQVDESREDNNMSSYQAPTPTPPPLCVPAATATP